MDSKTDTPYEPGDFVLVYSPEKSPTEKVFWRGQIFKITEKVGLTHIFDMRNGVDMPLRETVRMWRLFMTENISLEGFTIKRAIYRGGFGEVYYALTDAEEKVFGS